MFIMTIALEKMFRNWLKFTMEAHNQNIPHPLVQHLLQSHSTPGLSIKLILFVTCEDNIPPLQSHQEQEQLCKPLKKNTSMSVNQTISTTLSHKSNRLQMSLKSKSFFSPHISKLDALFLDQIHWTFSCFMDKKD